MDTLAEVPEFLHPPVVMETSYSYPTPPVYFNNIRGPF